VKGKEEEERERGEKEGGRRGRDKQGCLTGV